MSRNNSYANKLENTISGLEMTIMNSKDDAILAASGEDDLSAVRSVIDKQLSKYGYASGRQKKLKQTISANRKNTPRAPIDVLERLKLIRLVLSARPDAPSRLSSAFSGGRKPSDNEINELTDELIRLGMLLDNKGD